VIKNSLQQEAEKLILEKYALSGVIINQDMEILHFCGQTAPYIEPSAGSASLNLLRMARQDLMLELRLAVKQAIKKHNKVRREVVRILENGDHQSIVLHVIPLSATEPSKLYFLVLFDSDRKTAAVRKTGKLSKNNTADIKDVRIRELEHEMLEEQKHLQSIIEDQEATNQELQSASEEIQSTNEELQSTNEELETAKEELQSSNEELATVIEEHEIRNHELNAANSKLTNLLSNIDVATIILDRDRKILCFTAAAKPLLNLIDSDIGRPVSNIHHNFDVPDLEKKLKQVIETTIPWSSDFNDRNEHWYKITLRPYITINNYVDGVVMTLVNIDSNKNVERLQLALLQEKRLSTVVRDSSDTIMVLDFSNHILAWNRRAEEVYGYNEEEALRLSANELFPEKTRKEMQNLFERLQCSKLVPPGESLRCTKDGNVFKVWLTASVLLNGEHKPYAVAITEKEIL
jgi:two-component system CheB/CheR fusion protein